jgi:hypothetical protein
MEQCFYELLQNGPLKQSELLVGLTEFALKNNLPPENCSGFIDTMVRDGRVVKVEYNVSKIPFLPQAIYFPVGSNVRVINQRVDAGFG